LRMVRFFWENRQSFPAVDQLYASLIKDLNLGSHSVYAIKYVGPCCNLASANEIIAVTNPWQQPSSS
jgi:hypothetical protein